MKRLFCRLQSLSNGPFCIERFLLTSASCIPSAIAEVLVIRLSRKTTRPTPRLMDAKIRPLSIQIISLHMHDTTRIADEPDAK